MLWGLGVAAAGVAAWLFFGNALARETGGQNEEVGAGLAVAASLLLAAGLAVRRSLDRWDARSAAAALLLLVATLGGVLVVQARHVEPHDTATMLAWERLEAAPPGAPSVPAGLFPHDIRREMLAAAPGQRGNTTLSNHDAEALWGVLGPSDVGLLEGVAFRFARPSWAVGR